MTMLFDRMNQQAAAWVKDMMSELGRGDERHALHALRAGLQALRDRLTVDEAAKLAAQLPTLIRGLFYEGWDPTGKPLRIRHRAQFLALVREKLGPRGDHVAADDVVRALFRVLQLQVSSGELTHIVMTLPTEIVKIVGPDSHERAGELG
jgi:uncharacterized protein (DUF2267 family)